MLKSRNWLALVTGLLFICTAVIVVLNPLWNMAFLGWFFSLSVLIDGIISVADYAATKKEDRKTWHLVMAIITIIIGVSLLGDSMVEQAALVPFLLGFWLVFIGVSRIIFGLKEATELGKLPTALILVSGVFALIFGAIVFANPLFAGVTIVYAIAAALFAVGVMRIVEFFTKRVDDKPDVDPQAEGLQG